MYNDSGTLTHWDDTGFQPLNTVRKELAVARGVTFRKQRAGMSKLMFDKLSRLNVGEGFAIGPIPTNDKDFSAENRVKYLRGVLSNLVHKMPYAGLYEPRTMFASNVYKDSDGLVFLDIVRLEPTKKIDLTK